MSGPDRHADQRNFVESILRYIPGFKGYLEKEYRRESDYLCRTWMADRLQSAKRGLDDYLSKLVAEGQLDALPQCERIRSRLDGLINQLRGAVRGYSGFFDYVRVNEQLLDQVYEHDKLLMEDVEQLAGSIETLGSKSESPAAVASALLQHVEQVQSEFEKRGQLLAGLDAAQG